MENAELYSSANSMQRRDAKEILSEFRDRFKWPEKAKILDIGCGSGEVTTEILLPSLPKDFRELVGLDISLEMIQHARNLHSLPKVSFIQFDIGVDSNDCLEELTKTVISCRNDSTNSEQIDSDAKNLKTEVNKKTNSTQENELESNGYDVVFSFYCLHWVTNQRLALKNIYKLLISGGEALLVFLAKSPIFTLYRKLSRMELWKQYMKDVDTFIPFYQDLENPMENFAEILRNEGFKILLAECRERNYVFESATSLRNAIKAVNPFLPRIPNNLQEEFINECFQQTKILKLTEFKKNCYKVNYKLIVAHIKKPSKTLLKINK